MASTQTPIDFQCNSGDARSRMNIVKRTEILKPPENDLLHARSRLLIVVAAAAITVVSGSRCWWVIEAVVAMVLSSSQYNLFCPRTQCLCPAICIYPCLSKKYTETSSSFIWSQQGKQGIPTSIEDADNMLLPCLTGIQSSTPNKDKGTVTYGKDQTRSVPTPAGPQDRSGYSLRTPRYYQPRHAFGSMIWHSLCDRIVLQ